LSSEYSWDKNDAAKIWCFGPDESGPNMLVECCSGVQYLKEVKDSITNAFQWVTREGVLCDENCRGIRINLYDAKLHADNAHRGAGQMIPATRRNCYAC